jgi:endonuclease YncB( thermonuclease family)
MRVLAAVLIVLAQIGQEPATGASPRFRQEPLLVAEEVFKATVTSVEDGDSLVVKAAAEQTSIHIVGVDAPEMSQPGGPEAKAFLSALVLGKPVIVRLKSTTERLATVEVDGTDVSAALIRRGMAWHCPRYTDDRELVSAEAEARAAKRGLWAAPRPTPPWLYRGAGACWQQKKSGGFR